MKIVAWNLNHRIQLKAIPETVVGIVRSLAPDLLVLTEYVDADSRVGFKQALRTLGLSHISVSERRDRHNQVLIASSLRHEVGQLPLPMDESHAITNFLPVTIPELDVTIVGMRVPAYERSAQTKEYWVGLASILEAASSRRLILVGDLNADPNSSSSVGGKQLRTMCERGWQLSSPKEQWSYISGDGLRKSRVDHLLASPSVSVVSAAYRDEVDGIVAAGPKNLNPISDHAILQCEVSMAAASQSEVMFEVLAEGGSMTLYGVRTTTGWLFSRHTMDQTPALIDEPWIEHTSSEVDSWPAALGLFGDKRWHMLSPRKVHKDFRDLVLEEVEARYNAQGQVFHSTLYKWRAACGHPEKEQ